MTGREKRFHTVTEQVVDVIGARDGRTMVITGRGIIMYCEPADLKPMPGRIFDDNDRRLMAQARIALLGNAA